ncbi:hypothetical protein FRC07_010342 [Ceratobasidium sp. 392]|nr:hypothetical protein FRC07_010342 [Ceratobasidium sp. 392]
MLTSNPNGFSPLGGIDNTIRFALDEWKSARSLLAAAIRSYLTACHALRDAYILPSEHSAVEELLVTIDSELQSLVSDEGSLLGTRMSLTAMRNNSTTLVRVNRLPPEILANIFALSKTYCVRDDRMCFHNFTGVCAYWRQIATNRAELWTHIDVGPEVPDSLTKLLLERTQDIPIHVHLHEPNPKVHDDRPTPEHEVSRVTKLLSPHMHRVCTLDIESHSYSRSFVGTMLNLWFEKGDPSLAKTLLVFRPSADKLLCPNGQSRNGVLLSRSGNAMAILRSLTKLHLQNVKFDWDSGAYRGLVDLRLSTLCDNISMSVSQLADIISENPKIVTLKLRRLRITCTTDWDQPPPIELNCLKVLSLFFINSDSLRLLLPLIALPRAPSDLIVGLSICNDIHKELVQFFARSQMTTLYLYDAGYPFSAWTSLLNSLPSPHNLVLHEFHMHDISTPEKITPEPLELTSPPRLPTVTLLQCTVTLEGLKNLVSNHNIQDLHLERCRVYRGAIDNPNELEGVRTSLLEVYPELKCNILDTDSGWQAFYRKAFDR